MLQLEASMGKAKKQDRNVMTNKEAEHILLTLFFEVEKYISEEIICEH